MQGESSEMLEEGFVDGLQGLLEERVMNSLEGDEVQVGRAGARVASWICTRTNGCWRASRVASGKSMPSKGCKPQKREEPGLYAAKAGGARVVAVVLVRVRVRPG